MAVGRKGSQRLIGQSPMFRDIEEKLSRVEGALSLLLRTCDDAMKRKMNDAQRECLIAACDDVREVLGYAGRYLTPAQRKRFSRLEGR